MKLSLGVTIRQKRKSLKLSQEYVAGELGVSRQAVSKWETDQSEPTTNHLLKLADLLDCDIQELVSAHQSNEEPKQLNKPRVSIQKNIKMQMAAVFGRILILVGFLGYMNIQQDEFGSLPEWVPFLWYAIIFLTGGVLTAIASWNYFNKQGGSKKILWFDFLFILLYFLYALSPFEKGIRTVIVLLLSIVILSIQNINFFIPTWRKLQSHE